MTEMEMKCIKYSRKTENMFLTDKLMKISSMLLWLEKTNAIGKILE